MEMPKYSIGAATTEDGYSTPGARKYPPLSLLPETEYTLFAATGTLHIFAISGLHVGVMAVLFAMVLKLAGLSRAHWILPLAPALVVYTLMTGMRVSALRACLMAICYGSAFLFQLGDDVGES